MKWKTVETRWKHGQLCWLHLLVARRDAKTGADVSETVHYRDTVSHKKNDVKPCSINQSQKKRDHFYPRDAMLARVIATATCLSVFPSVRLSLCPSITRRYCVKTKKASVMISSPSGSPKTLVFWYQMSSPNSNGFPPIGPNGASKKGGVWKFSDFLALSVNQYLQNDSRYGQSYY